MYLGECRTYYKRPQKIVRKTHQEIQQKRLDKHNIYIIESKEKMRKNEYQMLLLITSLLTFLASHYLYPLSAIGMEIYGLPVLFGILIDFLFGMGILQMIVLIMLFYRKSVRK